MARGERQLTGVGGERPRAPRIAAPLGAVTTERLRLTPIAERDAAGLTPVFAEAAVWEYPYGRGMSAEWTTAFTARATEHWDRFGFGLWAVRTLADERVIGYLGLSMPSFLPDLIPAERMPAVEVGWRLDPGHWGRGYATEGALASLREGFQTLGLKEVCSAPQRVNLASIRVAQRIGMSYERTATLAATAQRGAVDIDLYWITRAQWRA